VLVVICSKDLEMQVIRTTVRSTIENCSSLRTILAPEVHGQVHDVVRGDDGAGDPVGARAVLVQQRDQLNAPASMVLQLIQ
jgi:hypothetical protein